MDNLMIYINLVLLIFTTIIFLILAMSAGHKIGLILILNVSFMLYLNGMIIYNLLKSESNVTENFDSYITPPKCPNNSYNYSYDSPDNILRTPTLDKTGDSYIRNSLKDKVDFNKHDNNNYDDLDKYNFPDRYKYDRFDKYRDDYKRKNIEDEYMPSDTLYYNTDNMYDRDLKRRDEKSNFRKTRRNREKELAEIYKNTLGTRTEHNYPRDFVY